MRRLVTALLAVAALEARAQQAPSPALTDGWFVTSDGVRLHYLRGGSGPTIVFLPGWTMPADIWEPQLRYFSHPHRVVGVDPRSQGASEHERFGTGDIAGLGLVDGLVAGLLETPRDTQYLARMTVGRVLILSFISAIASPLAHAQR